jgi:hypothetical protein
VGGGEKVGWVTAKSFSIAGQNLAPSFLVGGSETGHGAAAGRLGQNILGFANVEYDLAHRGGPAEGPAGALWPRTGEAEEGPDG